jgi:signal transduction histidine kinase/CheY-like chemotaxis protein
VADQADYFIRGLWGTLTLLTVTPVVQTQAPRLAGHFLAELLPTTPQFEDLCLIAADGSPTACAKRPGRVVDVPANAAAWFRNAARSAFATSSGLVLDPETGNSAAYLGVPIRGPGREPMGALAAQVNLKELRQGIDPVPADSPVRWAIVDTQGRVLLQQSPQAAAGKPFDAPPGMLRAEIIVPGTTWWVVAMMPEAVVASRIREVAWLIGAPLCAILLFTAVVGIGIAHSTWGPLRALAVAVRQIGGGEPPTRLPLEAGGELGEVARAFRDTLGSLTRRQRELVALLHANRALASSLDLDATLQAIVDQAATISAAPVVRLFMLDAEAQLLRCRVAKGLPVAVEQDFVVRVDESFSGEVAASRHPVAVADSLSDARLLHREHAAAYGLVSYLGLPVQLGDQMFGVLVFNTPEPRTYSEGEVAFLSAFAQQAALAIQNARLFHGEHIRRTQLEVIRDVTAEITREIELPHLLRLIQRRAMELVGAASGSLYMWNEASQLLTLEAWHGGDPTLDVPRKLGEGVIGTVAQRRQGVIVNDYPSSPLALPIFARDGRITAVLAEPLVYRDRLLGVIGVNNLGTEQRFTEDDRHILRLFAYQAAIALENARLFSEATRAYETLRHTQEELVRSEKLRGLGQMAAGVAHDLNNTLAVVLGQVELLRLRIADPEMLDGLETLERAADDGAHVVRRLQDFARQRAGAPLGAVDLARVVQDTVEITRPRWKDEPQREGHLIEIRTLLDPLPPILGHAAEVREVLTNLIFNAVDAMPKGGTVTITAHIEAEVGDRESTTGDGSVPADNRTIEVAVADTGVGMTDEVRQRMFDPFFTTKGVQGVGLGLSVAYGIMERHGGSIAATSIPGRGTTVRLRFRVAPPRAEPTTSAHGGELPPCRILLIDDDADVRATLGSLLTRAGHTVYQAEGGAAGVALFRTRVVDAVLTDLGMPEVNGWEVARTVKAERAHVPVILLTGWGEQPPIEPTGRGLVDRVLGKPCRIEDIQAALRDLAHPPSTATRHNPPPGAS